MRRPGARLAAVTIAVGVTTIGILDAKPAPPPLGRRVFVPPTPPPPPSSSAPIDPRCDNRTGRLDACTVKVGRGCESRETWSSTCGSLNAMGLQPRIVEAVATCVGKETISVGNQCEAKTLPKCLRDAVATACPEPDAAARCDALFQNCRLAAMKPKFTREQCVQIVSAMAPGESRDATIMQMSPTMDACGLESTLPFTPWAKRR